MTNKKNTYKKVSLVCLPPANSLLPLAGITAIKSFLKQNDIPCNIFYLNYEIDFKCFFKNDLTNEYKTMLPYIYLYNKYICGDIEKAEDIKNEILLLYANYFHLDKSLQHELFEEEISSLYSTIEWRIDQILEDDPLIIGFSDKFSQWIPAVFCAYLIKKKNKKIKTVIGGCSLKETAISYEVAFGDFFDYVIWGEGEMPMLELYRSLNFNENRTIPRIAYRNHLNEVIISSSNSNSDSFLNLENAPIYDISDYINQTNNEIFTIGIERIRGCNWNRCKFCYLAQGYQYREKTIHRFVSEIKFYIEQHNLYQFQLMDNDFIGSDLLKFKNLLLELIELKSLYPAFELVMVEVITKDLDQEIIKLMAKAGVVNAQIGLEAISSNLLNKIRKKQDFTENLFYIREALAVGMKVSGLNIIKNTLDETEEDIRESINNLYFFRFFLNTKDFDLNMANLAVANNSFYYRTLKKEDNLSSFNYNSLWNALSKRLFSDVDVYSLFDFFKYTVEKDLWIRFTQVLSMYKNSKYSYRILYNETNIIYKEYSKRRLIKEISLDDFTARILIILQLKVINFNVLIISLRNMGFEEVSESYTKSVLNDLFNEGLVFYSSNYEFITTIIVVDSSQINLIKHIDNVRSIVI